MKKVLDILEKSGKIKFLRPTKNWLAVFVLVLLAGLFYGNTLKNGFVHDDMDQIVNNQYIQSWKYLPKVVDGCIWEASNSNSCVGTRYYRPLHSLSYLITYSISPKPWFFHLVNLLYLVFVVVVLYWFVLYLSGKQAVAFFSALIFLIHPINTEAVNWIACVPEFLFTGFSLLSIMFFIKFRHDFESKKFMYLSLLFYFLAIMSKESAIFVPVLFLIIDKKFVGLNFNDSDAWNKIKYYFFFLLAAGTYFFARLLVMGNGGGVLQEGLYGNFSLAKRFYFTVVLFAEYLKKLFYPQPLTFFYNFDPTVVFLSKQFAISLLLFAGFFAAIAYFLKKKNNLMVFSFVWFFIFLSPVLVFADKIGENVFAERYLFAPMIGFSMILASLVEFFWRKAFWQKIPVTVVLSLLVFFCWKIVFSRNTNFKDNETIFVDSAQKSPDSALALYNLGLEYAKEEKLDQAQATFDLLVERVPNWFSIKNAYNNLGEIYRRRGDSEKAIEYYKKAIDASGRNDSTPYTNLAQFYVEQKKIMPALSTICKALDINANDKNVQDQFNSIVASIEGAKEKKPEVVYYDAFLGDGGFKASDEKKITYQSHTCVGSSCFYYFKPNITQQETLFPFLIFAGAASEKGELVNTKYHQDKDGGRLVLEIDSKFKDMPLTFMFPSCEGVYYQSVVMPGKNQGF